MIILLTIIIKKNYRRKEEEGLTTVLACDLLLNRDGLALHRARTPHPELSFMQEHDIKVMAKNIFSSIRPYVLKDRRINLLPRILYLQKYFWQFENEI